MRKAVYKKSCVIPNEIVDSQRINNPTINNMRECETFHLQLAKLQCKILMQKKLSCVIVTALHNPYTR